MNVAVVLGTRPEVIRLAPLIHEFGRRLGPDNVSVLDTSRQDDPSMSGEIWARHGLSEPAARLGGSEMSGLENIDNLAAVLGEELARQQPDAVIVHGDTNSALAGALAARANSAPLVHVGAGLRSCDHRAPEEHNGVITDQVADLCCAATWGNLENLLAEGIDPRRIVRTGSTVVEAVASRLPAALVQEATRTSFGVAEERYILATIHQPENTDDPTALATILADLGRAGRVSHRDVVLLMHPRTRITVARFGLSHLLGMFHVMDPIGHADFLSLLAGASAVVSDSGGVAEEVTILKRPLVVVRRATERTESVAAGFAVLAAPQDVFDATIRALSEPGLLTRLAETPSPYGDGTAARQIVAHTITRFGGQRVRNVRPVAFRSGMFPQPRRA